VRLKDIHIKIIVALHIIIFLATVILSRVKGGDLEGSIGNGIGIIMAPWVVVWLLYIIGIFVVHAVKYPREAVMGTLKFLGVCFLFLLGLFALAGLGFVLRWKPVFFLFLWLFVPCLSWTVNIDSVSSLLTDKGLQVLRCVFIGVVVVISFLFFTFWDNLRDNFGNACVKGYSVYYTEEYNDEGDYYERPHISANNWFIENFLQLSVFLLLLPLSAGNGVLTWMGITKEIKRRNLGKSGYV